MSSGYSPLQHSLGPRRQRLDFCRLPPKILREKVIWEKEGNFNQLVSDSIDVLTDNDASCVGSPCPEELPDILFMSAL
jgi:hypothetical protein